MVAAGPATSVVPCTRLGETTVAPCVGCRTTRGRSGSTRTLMSPCGLLLTARKVGDQVIRVAVISREVWRLQQLPPVQARVLPLTTTL